MLLDCHTETPSHHSNRTTVGLKDRIVGIERDYERDSNRTTVGLKVDTDIVRAFTDSHSNRTTVGLKGWPVV